MGIPALFRWLTQKYPKTTSTVKEEQHPTDYTRPNPNGIEFDNLYLDMNGIIHPCTHPENKPAPKTEDEMYVEIFKYIDRIIYMIRPRKIIYMAIDGVAPRAKMNQQRSRRFRAAQEAAILFEEEEKIKKQWEEDHGKVNKTLKPPARFDSNCITPGTPFMDRLAVALRYYIADRLNSNPAWSNVKVILSDASVPGEGEHKIMDFIRRQRNQPDYSPDIRHILYGLDADLIMLALATHEPHFEILREDVSIRDVANKACVICGQSGHTANTCTGTQQTVTETKKKELPPKPFIFLHISILREYLEIDLKFEIDNPACTYKVDLERSIDDWVFLCFFVGNDFLPHLPSLDIREGAIEKLVELWKKMVGSGLGYLTDSGNIDLDLCCSLMKDLGEVEDTIFRERKEAESRKKESAKRRKLQQKEDEERKKNRLLYNKPDIVAQSFANVPSYPINQSQQERLETDRVAVSLKRKGVEWTKVDQSNRNAADALKALLSGSKKEIVLEEVEEEEEEGGTVAPIAVAPVAVSEDVTAAATDDAVEELEEEVEEDDEEEDIIDGVVTIPTPHITPKDTDLLKPTVHVAKKVKLDESEAKKPEDEDEDPHDEVKLWEEGWKQRYYSSKFDVDADDDGFKQDIVKHYAKGLCWVLSYYYQGCQSWTWYYPYHYSPFASDFSSKWVNNSPKNDIKKFEMGITFNPFEQLMGVLPGDSRAHVPPAFQNLMVDENSEIIDFYPKKFPIDLNGKKFAWQGVAILPFINENRLRKAMEPFYKDLTEEEVKRNTLGKEYVWVGYINRLFEPLCILYGNKYKKEMESGIGVALDSNESSGLFGKVLRDDDVVFPGTRFGTPFLSEEEDIEPQPDILDNQTISAVYKMPKYEAGFTYKAKLLKGVKLAPRMLDQSDVAFIRSGGYNSRGRGRGRGGYRGRGHGRSSLGDAPQQRFGPGTYNNSIANNHQQPHQQYQQNHYESRNSYNDRSYDNKSRNDNRGGYNDYHQQQQQQQYRPQQSYGRNDYSASPSYGGGFVSNTQYQAPTYAPPPVQYGYGIQQQASASLNYYQQHQLQVPAPPGYQQGYPPPPPGYQQGYPPPPPGHQYPPPPTQYQQQGGGNLAWNRNVQQSSRGYRK